MNKITNPLSATWPDLLKRPTQTVQDIEGVVGEVFSAIKKDGDKAVAYYTQKFDKAELTNTMSLKKSWLKQNKIFLTNLKMRSSLLRII